jgi:subtilase family serine protease
MFPPRPATLLRSALIVLVLVSSHASLLFAQTRPQPRSVIVDPLDLKSLSTRPGNVRSAANAANDRGPVADSLPLGHMLLQLQRSPEQEQQLDLYLDQIHTKGSPNFHQWLTPTELQQQFGPTTEDIAQVTAWLTASGFTVNQVAPSGLVIDFSGTAATVRAALHTSIHNLSVNGVPHIANMQDPQIPTALADVVAGVVSLHDFRPRTLHKNVVTAHVDPRTHNILQGQTPTPEYTFTSGGTYQAIVPGDLATIYHLTPLFTAGYSGQGQTIVVIEDTNVYSTADWTTFRSKFGLSTYTAGSFTQVHPGSNCANPGVNADSGEAILDAEWASAAAPSAAIELASCADTNTSFGGLIALQNLIAEANPPKIISISYGECEAENGATANAAYRAAYQTAVAEGISVFVSSGDEGAASCDADLATATHGIAVSGFASTPYNVAVGGTDFGDTDAGSSATYWTSTNTATFASAKSYLPEIPWNDSCAGQLLSTYIGYATPYGTNGFCNSATGKKYYLSTASGSGGPSGCATGRPSTVGVVGGTCAGYAKPSWQSLLGVPADGVRDLPDVSLFAANGIWGHYYVFCWSDHAYAGDGAAACTGAPDTWSGAGGTSFSSPILAAIQALVNQKTRSAQGNPNYTYYALAAAEYGSSGSASCNSTKGNAVGSSCIFYDITKGDMDVNCTGTYGCDRPSGTNGVLSTSTTAYAPAYATKTGWDFATGIGSLNAYNLVYGW